MLEASPEVSKTQDKIDRLTIVIPLLIPKRDSIRMIWCLSGWLSRLSGGNLDLDFKRLAQHQNWARIMRKRLLDAEFNCNLK